MIHLNSVNGADKLELKYAQKVLDIFKENIWGVQMGIAYGGGVEAIGKLWKGNGTIVGYDTFEDKHPKHLTQNQELLEAKCMEEWYQKYGTEKLSYDYQRTELDRQELFNVVLIRGEVTEDSCLSLPHLHYAFLDMDLPKSMTIGFKAVDSKLVVNGYLLLHDVIPESHIPGCNQLYKDIMKTGNYVLEEEVPNSFFVALRRIK